MPTSSRPMPLAEWELWKCPGTRTARDAADWGRFTGALTGPLLSRIVSGSGCCPARAAKRPHCEANHRAVPKRPSWAVRQPLFAARSPAPLPDRNAAGATGRILPCLTSSVGTSTFELQFLLIVKKKRLNCARDRALLASFISSLNGQLRSSLPLYHSRPLIPPHLSKSVSLKEGRPCLPGAVVTGGLQEQLQLPPSCLREAKERKKRRKLTPSGQALHTCSLCCIRLAPSWALDRATCPTRSSS